MPLSEEELRLLEQMERALVEEDPKLASTMRGTSFQRAARRRAILAGVVFVLGMAVLTAGVVTSEPIVGVVGFLIMLGSAAVGVTALRNPAMVAATPRDSKHAGLGVVDGGKAGKPRRQRREPRAKASGTFMERMDERWRRRREQGPF